MHSPNTSENDSSSDPAASEVIMSEKVSIRWYRTKVDKAVMSRLMKRSDIKAARQCLLVTGLFVLTGTLCYLSFQNVNSANWFWSVPLVFICLFFHGTFCQFMGPVAIHELCHKTPFRNQYLNDFFMYLFSFLSWHDPFGFRASHVKHHQVTCYHDLDGEVVLPQKMDWDCVRFWFWQLAPIPHPTGSWNRICGWAKTAMIDTTAGADVYGDWPNKTMPASNQGLRLNHRNWARIILLGHLSLALIFIATGHWYLILIVSMSTFYCSWLCWAICMPPQHIGMTPNSPDFRLACRTYTCGRFIGFLYWNMQYHIEHHMFPAIPFYNLPELRKAIQHDLPPVTHGLFKTWREILPVLKKQRLNPEYTFIPDLPSQAGS
jgi:fatty acid desaturase